MVPITCLETERKETWSELSSELPHREGLVFMLCHEPKSQAGGSQSVRSSKETGNDRGAKGRREVNA